MVTIGSEDNRFWVLTKTIRYEKESDNPLNDMGKAILRLENEIDILSRTKEKIKELPVHQEIALEHMKFDLKELKKWIPDLEAELKYREKLKEVV